jgi:glycosyltransferase involved in cell wall biosynthesis
MRQAATDMTGNDSAGFVGPTTRGMPRVRVAHSGKQHAYRHALAVERCGALDRFITSSYFKPDSFPDRWLAKIPRFARMLRRRWQEGLPESKVVRRWRLELPELLVRRFFGPGEAAERCMFRRDAAFDCWVARKWAKDCDIYWGFQGSCLESLRAAKRRGIITVAEFATAHVTKAIELLSAEAQRHPEWADSISNLHFPDWYRERLEREPHEADICVVASQFSRQSLVDAGVAANRIRTIQLGADLERFSYRKRTIDGPFRVLFVGGVGQRKGIKYLLDAFGLVRCPEMELVLIGPLCGSAKALEAYSGLYTYKGRMDQSSVIAEMHRSHVLVLPSVFEGFGLVIVEAMATGMPVIASRNSVAPELIREGMDGFIVDYDDVHSIADRIMALADDRQRTVDMGYSGSCRAREVGWEGHTRCVAETLESIRLGLSGRQDL